MGTLMIICCPLARALEHPPGLHCCTPSSYESLWSYVFYRLEGFESMVINEKKEKEKQVAATRKTLKIFHLESLCKYAQPP